MPATVTTDQCFKGLHCHKVKNGTYSIVGHSLVHMANNAADDKCGP